MRVLFCSPSRVLGSLAAVVLSTALAGCGVSSVADEPSSVAAGLHGAAYGGQQPIAGAAVSLIVPGHVSYGVSGTGAALATTTTDANGSFTLPAYTCPVNAGVVYLLVTGGNSGNGANAVIGEAALLGNCSSLSASTFVVVSEVTTVVAAYALAPFATLSASTGIGIGTSATNLTGLNNAFGPANNLVNFSDGRARAVAAITGLTLPTAQLNTLANIVAACVNTAGATGTTDNCGILLTNTGVTGAAANTFGAAIAMAQNPGKNVAALYALASSSPPFQPALTAQPPDFALGIEYTGGGIANSGGTNGVAIDAAGNAWISTGYNPSTAPATHTVTEISPAGVYVSGTAGFGAASIVAPFGIAIDTNSNVFVADAYGNKVVKLSSAGAVLGTITSGNFANPNGLAIGAGNNIWVTNANGSVFNQISGTTLLEVVGSPYASGSFGAGIAIDPQATWTANYNAKTLTRRDATTGTLLNISAGDNVSAMILDANGAAWTTVTHKVLKYTDAGVLVTNAATGAFATNSSAHVPQDIAIDGLNRAWVSNYQSPYTAPGSLIELANDGTLLSSNDGFTAGGTVIGGPSVPDGIAIDGSGNVWIGGYTPANSALQNSTTGNFVTEVIGIAAPVVTPRAAATVAGSIGTRP